jgi:hypothetical protein
MNTQSNIGARRPCLGTAATFANPKSLLDRFIKGEKRSLFQSISKAFKDKFSHCRLAPSNLELQRRVKASQTQSNQIQPPHPLPVKKSVKYLALLTTAASSAMRLNLTIFDQIRLTYCALLPMIPNLQPATFNLRHLYQWSPFHSWIVVLNQDSLSRTRENIGQPI